MNLSGWFKDTVTYANQSGVGSHPGSPTFGDQQTAIGRWENGSTRGPDGIFYEATFDTETEIPVDARIWPPTADTADATEARRA